MAHSVAIVVERNFGDELAERVHVCICSETASPEEMLVGVLDTVDLHHGECSPLPSLERARGLRSFAHSRCPRGTSGSRGHHVF